MITLEERVTINYKELVKELLACGTCFNIYDKSLHCPKLLYCGHTLCGICLEKLCDLPKTKEESCFSCPMCREENDIENGFVADFRTNQLLDLIDRQGREVILRCSDHPSQELFFCETCDTLFCRLCDNTSHDGHNPEDLKHEVVLSSAVIKRKLTALYSEAKQCITKLDQAEKNVTSEIDKLKLNVEKISTDIEKTFEKVRLLIDDREKDLLVSVNKIHEDKLEILQNQLKMISKKRSKVVTEFKEFKFQGNMGDIANKMKELQVVTESVDNLLDPREKSSIKYIIENPNMKDAIQIYGAVRPI